MPKADDSNKKFTEFEFFENKQSHYKFKVSPLDCKFLESQIYVLFTAVSLN